jgi:sugar lactone lactonase YvrE
MLFLAGHCLFADEPGRPEFLSAWGQRGDQPGEFYSPIGIAIDKRDQVFVTDLNNARVQKFSAEGKYVGGFDLPLDKPGRRTSLVGGIAVDDEGRLYLTFMQQHRVAVYTESGELIRQWGQHGEGDGEFRQPGGIVLAPGRIVYVADQGNHRIQVFDADGNYLRQWGEHGAEPGQFGGNEPKGSRFGGPHFLARDSQGRIYTTEGTIGRIQQFSSEGRPLAAWGQTDGEPGGFGALQTGFSKNTFGPIGVFVDGKDRVWVSSLNDRVQCFTAEGEYLFGISETGQEPGQLARPHGMAMDSTGRLYVADAGNQRIQRFEIPEP